MARHFPPKRKTVIDTGKKRRGYDEGGQVSDVKDRVGQGAKFPDVERLPRAPDTSKMPRLDLAPGSRETGVYAPRQPPDPLLPRQPNMTRPSPKWMGETIPNQPAGASAGPQPWQINPMAKGGKVKKVVPVRKRR